MSAQSLDRPTPETQPSAPVTDKQVAAPTHGNAALADEVVADGHSDTPLLDALGMSWALTASSLGWTTEEEPLYLTDDDGWVVAEQTDASTEKIDFSNGSFGHTDTTTTRHMAERTDAQATALATKAVVEAIEGLQTRQALVQEDIAAAEGPHNADRRAVLEAELADIEGTLARRQADEAALKAHAIDPHSLCAELGIDGATATSSTSSATSIGLGGINATDKTRDIDGTSTTETAAVSITGGGVAITSGTTIENADNTAISDRHSVSFDGDGIVVSDTGSLTTPWGDNGTRVTDTVTESATIKTDEVGRRIDGSRTLARGDDKRGRSHAVSYGGGYGVKIDMVPTNDGSGSQRAFVTFTANGKAGTSHEGHATARDTKGSISGSGSVGASFDLTYERILPAGDVAGYLRAIEIGEDWGHPECAVAARLMALAVGGGSVEEVLAEATAFDLGPGESLVTQLEVSADAAIGAKVGGLGLSGKLAGKGSRVSRVSGTATGVTLTTSLGCSVTKSGSGELTVGAVKLGGAVSDGEAHAVTVQTRDLDLSNAAHLSALAALGAALTREGLLEAAEAHASVIASTTTTQSETLTGSGSMGIGPVDFTHEVTESVVHTDKQSDEGLVGSGVAGTRTTKDGFGVLDETLLANTETNRADLELTRDGMGGEFSQQHDETRIVDLLDYVPVVALYNWWVGEDTPKTPTLAGVVDNGLKAELAAALTTSTSHLRTYRVDEAHLDVVLGTRIHDAARWAACVEGPQVFAPWMQLRRDLVSATPVARFVEAAPGDAAVAHQALRLRQAELIATFFSEERDAPLCWERCLREWEGGPDLGELHDWPPALAGERALFTRLVARVDGLPDALDSLFLTATDASDGTALCDALVLELDALHATVAASDGFTDARAQSETCVSLVDLILEVESLKAHHQSVLEPLDAAGCGEEVDAFTRARTEALRRLVPVTATNARSEQRLFAAFDALDGNESQRAVLTRVDLVEQMEQLHETWDALLEAIEQTAAELGSPDLDLEGQGTCADVVAPDRRGVADRLARAQGVWG